MSNSFCEAGSRPKVQKQRAFRGTIKLQTDAPKKFNANKVTTYLDYLYTLDYKERPVSIERFINDPHYLGGRHLTKGGDLIYSCWKKFLKELFSDDTLYIGVMTGAIGIGKTYAAIIGVAYTMYRILCLKNPWGFFGLANNGKMAICFFNLTKSLGSSKGFLNLQNLLTNSPWFLEKSGGYIKGRGEETSMHFSEFEYVLASPYARGYGVQGHSVVVGIMDELDDPNESEGQRKRVVGAFDSTVRRFISRFAPEGESIGRLFLVASKQDEMSFLNVFVEEMKKEKRLLIADIPYWESRDDLHYCGKKFFVALGDAYVQSKILYEDKEVFEAVDEGCEVIEVPIEYLPDFEKDLIGALRDIAGRAVVGGRKHKLFPSDKFIKECFLPELKNPFEKSDNCITLGVANDDGVPLIKHLNLDNIKTERYVPRCIHMDIGYADGGDCLGISMAGISGWKDIEQEGTDGTFSSVKMPIIRTDFALRLKAFPNDQIPLYKVRKFVLDLRDAGFNIAQFSSDLSLASADTFQLLSKRGIPVKYISLDKSPAAYMDYKDMVFDNRWECFYHSYLYFELKNLEFHKDKQKVDHPDKIKETLIAPDGTVTDLVMVGSKDVSDGVVGAVSEAAKLADKYISKEQVSKVTKSMRAVEEKKEYNYWWTDIDKHTDKSEQKVDVISSGKSQSSVFLDIVKRANR